MAIDRVVFLASIVFLARESACSRLTMIERASPSEYINLIIVWLDAFFLVWLDAFFLDTLVCY